MDRLTDVICAPNKDERHGLYKICFEDKDGRKYIGYQTPEEFCVTKIKQKLFFEFNFPLELVEEFEEAVAHRVSRYNLEV